MNNLYQKSDSLAEIKIKKNSIFTKMNSSVSKGIEIDKYPLLNKNGQYS